MTATSKSVYDRCRHISGDVIFCNETLKDVDILFNIILPLLEVEGSVLSVISPPENPSNLFLLKVETIHTNKYYFSPFSSPMFFRYTHCLCDAHETMLQSMPSYYD